MSTNVRPLITLGRLSALVVLSLPPTAIQIAHSQSGSCEDLVMQAIQIVGLSCAGLARNEACYGHALVVATFQEGGDSSFETSGDLAGLSDLQALVTQPVDPDAFTVGRLDSRRRHSRPDRVHLQPDWSYWAMPDKFGPGETTLPAQDSTQSAVYVLSGQRIHHITVSRPIQHQIIRVAPGEHIQHIV
jgi:hypothetical protein